MHPSAHMGSAGSRTPLSQAAKVLSGSVITLGFGLPLLWMLLSSLRPQNDIFGYLFPLTPQSIFPRTLTWENYTALARLGYFQNLWNSVFATALTVLGGLLVSVPAAFSLGVLNFRGRTFVFTLLVAGFIVPFDVLSFPLADLVAKIGLNNTYVALVLPLVCNGFAIFLLRQFFIAVPRSLYEAARVDGASVIRILWEIYVPISRAPIIAAGIMFFVSQWQAYLWPLLVAPKQSIQLASVRLGTLAQDLYDPQFGQVLAYSCILFLLPAIFILFFQRYFVQGIATSGISG